MFTINKAVHSAEIDDYGHVNNVEYLNWALTISKAHWQARATATAQQSYHWVVLRHEIDYYQPAFKNDKLQLITWVEEMKGVKSIRRVHIKKNSELIANILTTWVMLSAETFKPRRIPTDLSTLFLENNCS
jgi:acyl-CoA thioester hydrolase